MRLTPIFDCGRYNVRGVRFEPNDGIRDPVVFKDDDGYEIEDPASLMHKDEYRKAFDRWANPEYLHAFFLMFRADLQRFAPYLKPRTAALRTIKESIELAANFARISNEGNMDALKKTFKPLDNRESTGTGYWAQATKAKGSERDTWIRLYALHCGDDFIVTGGAIKLVHFMDERPLLQHELFKLKFVRDVLAKKNITTTTGILQLLTT